MLKVLKVRISGIKNAIMGEEDFLGNFREFLEKFDIEVEGSIEIDSMTIEVPNVDGLVIQLENKDDNINALSKLEGVIYKFKDASEEGDPVENECILHVNDYNVLV